MLPRIQLLIRNQHARELVQHTLSEIACACTVVEDDTLFWDAVRQEADLVLIGRAELPDPVTDTIQTIRDLPGGPEVVVIVESEDDEGRAALLAAGCFAVVASSIAKETLRATFAALVERRQGELENQLLADLGTESQHRLSDFASTNAVMQAFLRMVKRVVQADSSLLILGETGVGKERLARAIHEESLRGDKPFVPVNCAAFPESLLEGELFGHLEGAFTGATFDRRGCFEMAHGGTIFLDEIGEVPRHVQVKLLRVLQERQIQRLGSEEFTPIDVRIMAATNKDLVQEMDAGRFRRDLYYRLSVVTLDVPPLREHPEDIPSLLDRYLDEFRLTLRKDVRGYAPIALRALCEYSWPGNVRELINVVERGVLLCEGDEITIADLPAEFGGTAYHALAASPSETGGTIRLPEDWQRLPWSKLRPLVLAGLERSYLESHLRATNGRIDATASQTGLSPRSLYVMMKRQGLRKESFKPPKKGVP